MCIGGECLFYPSFIGIHTFADEVEFKHCAELRINQNELSTKNLMQ